MRISSLLPYASITALAAASTPSTGVRAAEEIGYFLTRTDVAVVRTGTITGCPSKSGEAPTINFDWKVVSAGTADADQYVRVDVSGGFLAKRSTAFVLNPNGTLASFNSSSEGQGGAVLNSLLKAAGTLLLNHGQQSSGPAARADAIAYCRPEIADTLTRLSDVKKDIRDLETKIVQTHATSADLDTLERRRQQRADLVKALTLVKAVDFSDAADEPDATTPSPTWSKPVDPLGVEDRWFTSVKPDGAFGFDMKDIPKVAGYNVRIEPLNETFVPAGDKKGTIPPTATRALYYRRPIQAGVAVAQIGCVGSACYESLEGETPLLIGQWAQIQRLNVGHGGIFGSRQATAKFDTFGAPLELSFGSDSGTGAMASSIDAATGLAATLRDADLTALERQIKRLELEKKLEELQAPDGEN